MKDAIRMILVLVILGSVSGIMLTGVYNYASPLIQENERQEKIRAVTEKALPDAVDFREVTKGGVLIYEGIDEKGSVVGYAFTAEGNGYQGKIKLIAGLDTNLEHLKGIEILESSETPGLGDKITEDEFKSQFRGLYISPEIIFTKAPVSKDKEADGVTTASPKSDAVQAITGATISSKSVVDILNKEIARVRAAINKK